MIDIILWVLGFYFSGLITVIVLTFVMNRIVEQDSSFHTTVEDIVEIMWWSWFGVIIILLVSTIEFFENFEVPNHIRNFYENKKQIDE